MNKKGQFNFLTGLIVMVISLLMFGALFGVITTAFGMSKGNSGANCHGYIDPDANGAIGVGQNNSYNPALNTDTLSCQVLGFGPGFIVIAVVFGIVAGLISGKLGQTEQPQYQQYGQY